MQIDYNSTSSVYSYYVNGTLGGTVQGDGVATGISTVMWPDQQVPGEEHPDPRRRVPWPEVQAVQHQVHRVRGDADQVVQPDNPVDAQRDFRGIG